MKLKGTTRPTFYLKIERPTKLSDIKNAKKQLNDKIEATQKNDRKPRILKTERQVVDLLVKRCQAATKVEQEATLLPTRNLWLRVHYRMIVTTTNIWNMNGGNIASVPYCRQDSIFQDVECHQIRLRNNHPPDLNNLTCALCLALSLPVDK